MRNIFKFSIFAIALCVPCAFLSAQNNTSSPYSGYGIGEYASKSFGQHQAMGGSVIGMRDPYHINITNPASYSAFLKQSFLFEFGLRNKLSHFSTAEDNHYFNDINIHYISFGFPLTHWWSASMGLNPFSDIGYNINTPDSTEALGKYEKNYFGKGGINQAFIGTSLQFFNRLSLGINFCYLYGNFYKVNTLRFLDEGTTTYSYQKQTRTKVGDIYCNFGLQYHDTLLLKEKKYLYTAGAVFDNKSEIDVENSFIAATMASNYTNLEILNGKYIVDTIQPYENQNGTLELPTNFGIGFSFGIPDKFTIAGDFYTRNWKSVTVDSMSNSTRISIGAEYVPDIKSGASYYRKQIHYRLGGHFSKTGLVINNTQINDFGISFGVGLPVKQKIYGRMNARSSMNLTVEAGSFGTTDNNLINEKYFIVTLNLTLFDNNWFIKRKFD
ncbi:MAG: hypothetical protein KJ607_04815 [Bacteroidetes bacterium]|nr:hypothetical protein [Bacteroidota bacterium]